MNTVLVQHFRMFNTFGKKGMCKRERESESMYGKYLIGSKDAAEGFCTISTNQIPLTSHHLSSGNRRCHLLRILQNQTA